MSAIYEQFDKATAQFGAYAIFKGGKYVARVVFKYPRDGAGRLFCYVQVWGSTMVRAYAGGCGYDKRTAAFESAAGKLVQCEEAHMPPFRHIESFKAVAAQTSGERWNRRLEGLGYVVACVAD